MASLWADGWFYISAGGFLVSCVLFAFLLGQYRAALDAEDEEPVLSPQPLAAQPAGGERVYVPKPVLEAPTPVPVAPVARPAPAPVKSVVPAEPPTPKLAAEPVVKKSDATSTGPLSPAVVYLQNLKGQMERLEKEITGLKAAASQHTSHNETILKRLAELAEKLESAVARVSSPGPASPPAAELPRNKEDVSAALPAVLELEPQRPALIIEPERTAPIPAAEPMRSIELDIAAAIPAPQPKPEAKETAQAPDADKTMIIEHTVSPVKLTDAKAIPLPTRPGFEGAEPPKTEAPAPQPEADKPAEAAVDPAPKPARKGPVWPI